MRPRLGQPMVEVSRAADFDLHRVQPAPRCGVAVEHVAAGVGAVVRRPLALDAKRHLGLRGRYPQCIALPDRWWSWWLFAVPTALAMVRKHKPEVIWSTFPIATAHLIGMTLQRLTGLPWVADFRDPMLQDDFPSHPLQRRMFAWIERQAIQRCTRMGYIA